MSILSITFHAVTERITDWEQYLQHHLPIWLPKTPSLQQWYLSEIESEMIQEGKNYNLLLFFHNETERASYISNELPLLGVDIQKTFGTDVMVFESKLNPILQ